MVIRNIVRNFTTEFKEMNIMTEKKYCIKTETLAGFAKALGHPARIAIMKFLAKQETCYFGDIHEELPIAKATVSQHLSALKEAGLIQGEIETPKVKYCINRENWAYAQQLFSEFFNMELCEKMRSAVNKHNSPRRYSLT